MLEPERGLRVGLFDLLFLRLLFVHFGLYRIPIHRPTFTSKKFLPRPYPNFRELYITVAFSERFVRAPARGEAAGETKQVAGKDEA
jgi:hypothetical protein